MKKVTINGLYRELMPCLSAVYGQQEARQMLVVLFEDLLNIGRQHFMTQADRNLEPEDEEQIRQAVEKLLDHIPIQYITGKTYFFDMELLVKPGVLIPRPETEEMVYLVKNEYLKQIRPEKILDVGTGSGCIALAMKKMFPEAKVVALDRSTFALEVARTNADRLKLDVDFIQLDFLKSNTWTKPDDRFDLIISNPPYVRESEKAMMKPNVLNHEPHQALFVDDVDPLIFYERLRAFAADHLSVKGRLIAEINEALGREVRDLFSMNFSAIHLPRDLSGKERFVVAAF